MQASKEAVQNADKRLPFAHPVDVLDAAYQSTLEVCAFLSEAGSF